MASGTAWKSVQREALYVWSRAFCCIFLEIGMCFLNLALASVSTNAVQLARTQIPEVRELRVAPLLAATCARQKARYEFTHVRGTTDDARARFELCVPRTSIAGRGQRGSAHDVADSVLGADCLQPCGGTKTNLRWYGLRQQIGTSPSGGDVASVLHRGSMAWRQALRLIVCLLIGPSSIAN